jgi:urease accessory protein
MRSHARLTVELTTAAGGRARSVVRRQRSHGALVLRPTIDVPPAWATAWGLTRANVAAVRLVAGAAGPVGGDHWRFDIEVGEGAALLLSAAAGTLILPGPHGEMSRSETHIQVGKGGTLIWDPGVQIAAAGCFHQTVNRIDLAADARLLVREETVLGRHGEQPGRFRQRLRVTCAGKPLHDQELGAGADVLGWDGPAVLGGRRAVGAWLVIDPARTVVARQPRHVIDDLPDTAVMPLPAGILISGLAHDAVKLRRNLEATFAMAREADPGKSAPSKSYTVKKIARRSA